MVMVRQSGCVKLLMRSKRRRNRNRHQSVIVSLWFHLRPASNHGWAQSRPLSRGFDKADTDKTS